MLCAEIPIQASNVSVLLASLVMEMWLVKQQRSDNCVNPTLTAQTMPNVRQVNVCADQASLQQELCVWMWMSVDQPLVSVVTMLSVSIPLVASLAHASHHLLAVHHL